MLLRRHISALGLLFLTATALHAEITELHTEADGTLYGCTMSGLSSSYRDCDHISDFYNYIFVGTITSLTPIADHEYRLQLSPQEIFHGSFASPLTIGTSQSRCGQPLHVGDKWLFFLHKEPGHPLTFDPFASPSLPIDRAQEVISTLRRLQSIGNDGILRGQVIRGQFEGVFQKYDPLPNTLVFASGPDKTQYSAKTDQNGNFEFPRVAAGEYNLSVEAVGRYKPDDTSAKVPAGSCIELTLDKERKTRISGSIKNADGSPASKITVALFYSKSSYTTVTTDEKGHYSFNDLRPGKYVIGINYLRRNDWLPPNSGGGIRRPPNQTLYFSNVRDFDSATVLDLQEDVQLDSTDITLPTQP